MKNVLISPYSQKLRNGGNNPKNYPHWRSVVNSLVKNGIAVSQIGIAGETDIVSEFKGVVHFNYPLKLLAGVVKNCSTWASVDNFFHHFCALHNKPGVAIFGKSDPNIFGHQINTNLLKDRKYLRPHQYAIWEEETFSDEVWVAPDVVVAAILDRMKGAKE